MSPGAGEGPAAVTDTMERSSPQTWFADGIRLVLAPLVLLFSGFVTTDFLLSGVYTWPRTSRILALTLTALILSYEFVYKEQRGREGGLPRARKALVYSCMLPYGAGALALVALALLAGR